MTIQVNDVTVIDDTRNITNVDNIAATGSITLTTGQVTTNSASNPLLLGVNGVERFR